MAEERNGLLSKNQSRQKNAENYYNNDNIKKYNISDKTPLEMVLFSQNYGDIIYYKVNRNKFTIKIISMKKFEKKTSNNFYLSLPFVVADRSTILV